MTSVFLIGYGVVASLEEGLVTLKFDINTKNVMHMDCWGVVKPGGMLFCYLHALQLEINT